MKKVSVIVPIYNSEDYIEKCIGSLLAQTLCGIEIIFVNDGTKDRSGEIAKGYAEANPETCRYLEKQNGGSSDARNYGMSFACGEYIAFVDPDDWIDPTMLEKLWNEAKNKDADIVECGFYMVYGNRLKPVMLPEYKDKSDCLANGWPNQWNKIYRTRWLKRMEAKFPVGLWHEDIEFYFKILPFANRVPPTINLPLYYYLQRAGSIMTTPSRKILDLHRIYANLFDYYGMHGLLEQYGDILEYKYVKTCFCSFLERMLKMKDVRFRSAVIDEHYRLLNDACPAWRKNKLLKRVSFINIYLRSISPFTLNIMKRLYPLPIGLLHRIRERHEPET